MNQKSGKPGKASEIRTFQNLTETANSTCKTIPDPFLLYQFFPFFPELTAEADASAVEFFKSQKKKINKCLHFGNICAIMVKNTKITQEVPMKELNETQRKMYEYLAEQAQRGVMPTVREIGSHVGLKSTGSVQRYLERLEEAGYIERDPMLSRSIRVKGEKQPTVQVPLLGTVTAGMPILAHESIEGYVPFMCTGGNDKSLFALRVRGDSMVNAGILSGDIIIAEKTPTAANGEIVVALLEDEATVKRFYKENGHFRLQPENDDYAPIISDEVIVLGRVISLMRSYN